MSAQHAGNTWMHCNAGSRKVRDPGENKESNTWLVEINKCMVQEGTVDLNVVERAARDDQRTNGVTACM